MQNPKLFHTIFLKSKLVPENSRLILIGDLKPHTLIEMLFRPSEIVFIPSVRKIQFVLLHGYLS